MRVTLALTGMKLISELPEPEAKFLGAADRRARRLGAVPALLVKSSTIPHPVILGARDDADALRARVRAGAVVEGVYRRCAVAAC